MEDKINKAVSDGFTLIKETFPTIRTNNNNLGHYTNWAEIDVSNHSSCSVEVTFGPEYSFRGPKPEFVGKVRINWPATGPKNIAAALAAVSLYEDTIKKAAQLQSSLENIIRYLKYLNDEEVIDAFEKYLDTPPG